PAHHRDQPPARVGDLGVVGLDRGRDDDDLGGAEIGRVVADHHLDALLAQPPDVGALGDVAALHLVAQIVQDLRDAAHADAADSDEVDDADGKGDRAFHDADTSPIAEASTAPAPFRSTESTTSARRAAASGRARAPAQAARVA